MASVDRPSLALEVSLYLDLVRFSAAMAVFVAHFGLHRLSGGFLWQLGAYGHEAVTVFFVLSGFVIAYAADTRETTARSYAVSRLARLYSVVVPAVLLTPVLDFIGSTLRPELYVGWGYTQDLSFWRFFSALSFTNQVWTLNVLQGSNASYWSMGYEVPYYVLFGLATYLPGRWRWLTVAVATAFGPSILSALPVWLLGVATYRLSRRGALTPRAGSAVFTLALVAWVIYELLVWKFGRPLLTPTSLLRRRELIQDAIVGLCFAGSLLGLTAAPYKLGGWLRRWQTQVRWLAGATFTLYLLHEPLAQCLLALLPWAPTDARSRFIVFFGTLLLVFALSSVTERRKEIWRKAFHHILGEADPGPTTRTK